MRGVQLRALPATLLGTLVNWNALERAIDRWASLGAFALAVSVIVAVALI